MRESVLWPSRCLHILFPFPLFLRKTKPSAGLPHYALISVPELFSSLLLPEIDLPLSFLKAFSQSYREIPPHILVSVPCRRLSPALLIQGKRGCDTPSVCLCRPCGK